MILYTYDKYKGNRNDGYSTDQLIPMALRQYIQENESVDLAHFDLTDISRTKNGKPYIRDFPIRFSVSHSDSVWICLIGDSDNGVDLQLNHHKNFEAIAHRFFLPEEQLAVKLGGKDAFFSIWCRKEAFIKYFGFTIGETLEWLDVARNGKPVDQMEYKGTAVYFSDLRVNHDYECVAATGTKEQIWIKELQTD